MHASQYILSLSENPWWRSRLYLEVSCIFSWPGTEKMLMWTKTQCSGKTRAEVKMTINVENVWSAKLAAPLLHVCKIIQPHHPCGTPGWSSPWWDVGTILVGHGHNARIEPIQRLNAPISDWALLCSTIPSSTSTVCPRLPLRFSHGFSHSRRFWKKAKQQVIEAPAGCWSRWLAKLSPDTSGLKVK